MPINTPFVSILDFGAEPNDPDPEVRRKNSKAFNDAQDKMQNDFNAWGHPLFVPSGTFWLADDLHIKKSLKLFGLGVQGESILKFPEIFQITAEALACLTAAGVPDETVTKMQGLLDKEYLDRAALMKAAGEVLGDAVALAHQAEIFRCAFVRGTSLIIDPGQGNEGDPTLDGSECVICDLQIISEEGWETDTAAPFNKANFDPPELESTSKGTPGIMMGTTATIERVYIQGFTGTGIQVRKLGATNVNQWRIHDVYIVSCGGHGIHVGGHGLDQDNPRSETQGGFCSGAKIFTAEGNGIYDGSFGGNTYVGCYVEETKGRGYASDSPGQNSFIGCFAEAIEPNRFRGGGNVWVGGGPGVGFTADTSAFITHGYGNVYPFEVPNLKDDQIKLFVGYPNDGSDPTTICAWKNNNGGEFYVMRWDMDNKIWTIENGSAPSERAANGEFLRLSELTVRQIATYLTGKDHPRGPWLQGFGEILLGPPNDPIKISYGGRPEDRTGEPGDIVYLDLKDANPEDVSHIGYVCIGADRKWMPFGKIDEEKPPE